VHPHQRITDQQSVPYRLSVAKEVAASLRAAGGRCSAGAACAAVDKIEGLRKPEDFVGHRKRSDGHKREAPPYYKQLGQPEERTSVWMSFFIGFFGASALKNYRSATCPLLTKDSRKLPHFYLTYN
jgi:hypothetical protein